MRIDGNAAAVVRHRQEAVGLKLDLDPVGVAGKGLVHGIVDHLCEEVMQRLLVGAADIHPGPAAHRLQPLEHLDVVGRIGTVATASRSRRGFAARATAFRRVKQILSLRARLRSLGHDHAYRAGSESLLRLCHDDGARRTMPGRWFAAAAALVFAAAHR